MIKLTEADLVYLHVLVEMEKSRSPEKRLLLKIPEGGHDALCDRLLDTHGVDYAPIR
jgi:hypothetical protein